MADLLPFLLLIAILIVVFVSRLRSRRINQAKLPDYPAPDYPIRDRVCSDCEYQWRVQWLPMPSQCPSCGSIYIHPKPLNEEESERLKSYRNHKHEQPISSISLVKKHKDWEWLMERGVFELEN